MDDYVLWWPIDDYVVLSEWSNLTWLVKGRVHNITVICHQRSTNQQNSEKILFRIAIVEWLNQYNCVYVIPRILLYCKQYLQKL